MGDTNLALTWKLERCYACYHWRKVVIKLTQLWTLKTGRMTDIARHADEVQWWHKHIGNNKNFLTELKAHSTCIKSYPAPLLRLRTFDQTGLGRGKEAITTTLLNGHSIKLTLNELLLHPQITASLKIH